VRRGLLLGFVGVVIFAMTFPMTRLAVGDASSPQMSPAFVTAARAALALLFAVPVLGERVARAQWVAIGVGLAGVLLMPAG
jgi:drug/metabolite transporter (DMT)-like permease